MKKAIFICSVLLMSIFVSCAKPGDATVKNAMDAYQKQNYEEALGYFRQALEEETNYSDEMLFTFISMIYMAREDYKNAIVYQEKSLATKKDYMTMISLGMNYHLIQDDENAEKTYRSAVELEPSKPEGYAMLGALYLGQEKTDSAVEFLEKAEKINPRLSVVHANLAVAYAQKGDFQKSSEELSEAKNQKCENIEVFEKKISEITKK